MNIFLDHQDYSFFLRKIFEALSIEKQKVSKNNIYIRIPIPLGSIDLVCYCLMPNHYHILLRQNADISISRLMVKVCTSYAKYFNKKYNRVGTLFQDRFKAVLIENDEQYQYLIEYIHKNPVRAGIVETEDVYPYSSARGWRPSKGAIKQTDNQ